MLRGVLKGATAEDSHSVEDVASGSGSVEDVAPPDVVAITSARVGDIERRVALEKNAARGASPGARSIASVGSVVSVKGNRG